MPEYLKPYRKGALGALMDEYERAGEELMRQMGQAEYAIDVRRLTLETLQERFLALQGHTAEFTAAVRRRLPAVRQALETQYDSAFALLQAVS